MKKYHSIKDELFAMQSIARKQANIGIMTDEKIDNEDASLTGDTSISKAEVLHSISNNQTY